MLTREDYGWCLGQGGGFLCQHLSSTLGSQMRDPVMQKDTCHSCGTGWIFRGGLPAGLGWLSLWNRCPTHALCLRHCSNHIPCWLLNLCGCSLLWSCQVDSNSVTPWTVSLQAPLSMGFPRQEYRSGLPFPSPTVFLYVLGNLARFDSLTPLVSCLTLSCQTANSVGCRSWIRKNVIFTSIF